MRISKEHFFSATSNLKIPEKQAEALWSSLENLENEDKGSKVSSFSKWMYYFGAMIIICAMTWWMNLSWEWFGGGGIFIIATLYALIFTLLGAKLWKKQDLRIPAGLLITIAVCMTPLAIYGLETYFKLWPQDQVKNYSDFFYVIKGNWIYMELGTIIAGIIALRFFPFPFITAPIFFAAWFFILDVIPLLLGKDNSWEEKEWLSLGFGVVLIGISYVIHRKYSADYAFWGYLFGALIFWANLSAITWDKGEFVSFIYLLINILMMIVSILLNKRIFMILGALGSFIYFGHLAYDIFEDSILFPFVMSILGLIVIYLGVMYQKNRQWIETKIKEKTPESIRQLFPFEHES